MHAVSHPYRRLKRIIITGPAAQSDPKESLCGAQEQEGDNRHPFPATVQKRSQHNREKPRRGDVINGTILVTGVAGLWGSSLLQRLGAEVGIALLGIDAAASVTSVADFYQADLRNPLLEELLASERVHTVCHLQFQASYYPNPAASEANVKGTANLLRACVASGVQRVVLKSSTMVYGARSDNPAVLSESRSLRAPRRYGYLNDWLAMEALCATTRRQTPELELTCLRFPGIVGPAADTPMTRFLSNRWAPALLGFDPMMQLIHEQDVVEALAHAVLKADAGVFNVAARDPMPLSQLMVLAGKRPLPVLHPLAYWGSRALRASPFAVHDIAPLDPDYLRYPWVADLRRMEQELSFVPRFSARETALEFANQRQADRTWRQTISLDADEKRLREILLRRRARQAQQAGPEQGDGDG
jgi:UDP-glucose 4-epimerase